MIRVQGIMTAPIMLALAVSLSPGPVAAQYLYLDTNGNGVHDSGDFIRVPCGIDIWLDTTANRDGSPAVCGTGPQTLSFNSYEFILRATGGTIAWGPFTNRLGSGNRITRDQRDTTEVEYYHNGWTTGNNAAGKYLLGTLAVVVLSGRPAIDVVPSHPGHGWMATGFGTPCAGSAAREHWHRLGPQWIDVDGLPPSPSIPSLLTAPGIVAPTYLEPVVVNVQTSPDCDAVSSLTADISALPPGNDAVFTPTAGNLAGTFTWHPTAMDHGDFPVIFTASGPEPPQSRTTTIHLVVDPVAVEEKGEVKPILALWQNRPNPFNPVTTILYSLPRETRARLAVYNLSGRLVALLVDRVEPAGRHQARWSGDDDTGRPLGSGVYQCQLSTAFGNKSRPIVLVR